MWVFYCIYFMHISDSDLVFNGLSMIQFGFWWWGLVAMVCGFDLDQWVMDHGGSNPHCVAFMGSDLRSFHKSRWLGSLFLFCFYFILFIFQLVVVMQLWWLVVISEVILIGFTMVVFRLWWLVMIVDGCYGFLWGCVLCYFNGCLYYFNG